MLTALLGLRFCTAEGELDFKHTSVVGSQPKHLMPWFTVPNRQTFTQTIIFGHWSALGFYHGENCYGIDTGCLWGGQLTALKLEKNNTTRYSIDCDGI